MTGSRERDRERERERESARTCWTCWTCWVRKLSSLPASRSQLLHPPTEALAFVAAKLCTGVAASSSWHAAAPADCYSLYHELVSLYHELVQAAKIAVSNSVDLLRRCRIVSAFSEGLEEGREGLRCVQSAGGPERDRALGGEGGGGRFIPSQRSVAEEDPERDRATRVEQEQQRERERERERLY